MAAAVGDRATCQTFVKRAGSWRNVFDPSTGYVRPRSITGQWVSGIDPNYNDSASGKGFPEGDGAQYTWMVPHDPAGLFAALGGPGKARARLDHFFEKLNTGFASPYAFMGNEPNSNAPWLYDWLGEPGKAADIVRRTILSLFDSSPGGYPGNDDLGQMSAWYILGALGIYPAIPGSDVLALGSPLFPKATLRLGSGNVTITGRGASRAASYVNALKVNGKRWSQPWLRLADIARGGSLAFSLSAKPGSRWGTADAGAPPSYGPGDAAACDS
jgi:predicted alpha-1,2-mannosidase